MTSYEQVEPEPYIPHDYERSCECKSCSRERGQIGNVLRGLPNCSLCGSWRDERYPGELCRRCEEWDNFL